MNCTDGQMCVSSVPLCAHDWTPQWMAPGTRCMLDVTPFCHHAAVQTHSVGNWGKLYQDGSHGACSMREERGARSAMRERPQPYQEAPFSLAPTNRHNPECCLSSPHSSLLART